MSNPSKHNPWAGLSSYPDPASGESCLVFCGRDNESYDVTNLIDNNIFVTLYGRSGTGKTSLLNAGVFPLLRQKGYLPVRVRLSMDAMDLSFQQGIIQMIANALPVSGAIETHEVVPLPEDDQSLEYLWCYFARTRFSDADGRVLFPVIVLDQFEEVFRTRREDAEALLCQIHFMMDEGHALDDRVIDGTPYTYDYNFRFVVSIREDDLYRLEDSIDNNYLAEMKRCRFRLRNLSEEEARDVVLVPGGDCFMREARDQIANLLIGMARSREDHTVSALVLSLVCSRIYDDCQQTGSTFITVPIVEQFIKGNPFERFYKEATEGLSRRERAYIEKNLVDSEHHRNSIPESDFFHAVRDGSKLFEGSKKILQRVSTSSGGGSYRIELIHDSFCDPLALLKEKREQRERSMWLFIAMGIALMSVIVGFHFVRLNKTITRQKQNLESAMLQLRTDSLARSEHLERIRKDSVDISTINSILEQKMRDLDHANKRLDQKNRELQDTIRRKNDLERKLAEMGENLPPSSPRHEMGNSVGNANAVVDSTDVLETLEDVFEVDGLVFSTPNPTTDFLMEWVNNSKAICANLIQGKTSRFSVPKRMIDEDPVLVYLVLNSKSISSEKEKQEWFDLYDLMNESQIMKLHDILYRETYKLKDIERKYQQKQIEIDNKYFELSPDSVSRSSVTMDPTNDLETLEDVYEVDGLVFSTPNPTTDFLMKWVNDSKAICANLIQGKTTRFSVSKRMIDEHPVLVYLVLNSKSISSEKEKQQWFDLYDLMDENQIMKLYDILYRETFKLEEIERKYQQKQTEVYEKYSELYPNL